MNIQDVSEKYGITRETLRYYERIGMIPPVRRTASGIRDYDAEDLLWVELAVCMRKSGLPVQAMVEYARLTREGEASIGARIALLRRQREALYAQRRQIDVALNRLNYKIGRYEEAEKTGELTWDEHFPALEEIEK